MDPVVRFNQFRDPWKENKFKEIVVNSSTTDKNATNHKCIELESIESNSGRLIKLFKSNSKSSTKKSFSSGQVLFGKLRPYLKKYYHPKFEGVCSSEFWVLSAKNKITNDFLYYLIQTDRFNKAVNVSSGSKMPRADWKYVAKSTFFIPNENEQQKIATFLTGVDNRIQQLEKKKELMEEYKKGMMQKILSQEIRFEDDKGKDFPEWEEKPAEDIFVNITNKNHSGDLPLLAVTQDTGVVYRSDLSLKINSSNKGILGYKIIEPGDFIISLRSFQGGIEYSTIKGISSPAYTVFRSKIKIDSAFYKNYFKSELFINRLNTLIYGIRDGKQISYGDFKSMRLPHPSHFEQTKIGIFFTAIDNNINQLSVKIKLNKKFKKGLLQQMFV